MSSTNRGYNRHVTDYYVTPKEVVREFLNRFFDEMPEYLNKHTKFLDPSCGGSEKEDATYTSIIREEYGLDILGMDIREDSKADIIDNFLTHDFKNEIFDVIITNPPFFLAQEFIERSIELLNDNGVVIMLLRLNFWGSRKRINFFNQNMPVLNFIHHKRISFITEDIIVNGKKYRKGSTDSIEYAHFVWKKQNDLNFTKTFII